MLNSGAFHVKASCHVCVNEKDLEVLQIMLNRGNIIGILLIHDLMPVNRNMKRGSSIILESGIILDHDWRSSMEAKVQSMCYRSIFSEVVRHVNEKLMVVECVKAMESSMSIRGRYL